MKSWRMRGDGGRRDLAISDLSNSSCRLRVLSTRVTGNVGSLVDLSFLGADVKDRNVSNRGDIVIDPFLRSGSTLIAADKTGRVCRGVELDPLYVDVVVRPYEAATGNPAVLIETGEVFDVLAAHRSTEAAQVSSPLMPPGEQEIGVDAAALRYLRHGRAEARLSAIIRRFSPLDQKRRRRAPLSSEDPADSSGFIDSAHDR
jgi:hypothetical protein